MQLWRKVREALRDRPVGEIPLAAGAALTFLVRFGTYGLAAVAGIVVARALGASDRGVYSLVTTIALMFAAFTDLGISHAGIYFAGQRRYTMQTVASNNLVWVLMIGAAWVIVCLSLAVTQPAFLPDELGAAHLLVIALGGVFIQLDAVCKSVVVSSGSVLGYNAVEFLEPFLRALLIVSGVVLFGFGIVGVLSAWLAGVAITALFAALLMSRWVTLLPRLHLVALRSQLAFGIKGSIGFILQAANHRLDVLLVAAFAGTAALGHYAVAFGMAELLWQVPFALGVIFFPKVSAMDPETNAEIAATTCRRALFIVGLGVVALLLIGRPLIGFLYGEEFLPGVTAFYILAPSALFYTIHRVLSSALAGRGMPEASLYGGLISIPVTIGLGVLLIPRMGIEGAALVSSIAYALNAAVILVIFLRVTRRSMADVLLMNRTDVEVSWQTAREFVERAQPAVAD
jgi:O-antigen/teichoic acid export membrane protein